MLAYEQKVNSTVYFNFGSGMFARVLKGEFHISGQFMVWFLLLTQVLSRTLTMSVSSKILSVADLMDVWSAKLCSFRDKWNKLNFMMFISRMLLSAQKLCNERGITKVQFIPQAVYKTHFTAVVWSTLKT